MIDVGTERLLPAKELSTWLEARGYGRRVNMRTVRRWIECGSDGARLEAVKIDGQLMTSLEAVQRWVAAQNPAEKERKAASKTQPASSSTSDGAGLVTLVPSESERVLVEHRLLPTELDRVIERDTQSTEATRRLVAGVLFRTGHRSIADLENSTLESLLSLPRIGRVSRDLIRRLKAKQTDS